MDYKLEEEAIESFPKFLQSNALLYCVVFLLVLKLVTVLITLNVPANIFFADITKSALENFVNQTRQSVGLQALTENTKLDQAAQMKAENMVQYNYFNHTSPTGISPWYWFSQAGYVYKYAGENLAIGFFDSQEVYNAWLNSPSHKANILNPHYTEVGTAVLPGFGGNNTIVVVQEFGTAQGAPLPAKTITKPVAVQKQPQPTPIVKTPEPAPEVLSQSTQSQVSIKALPVAYNYSELVQDVIYGVSLIVIGILITLIFFSFNFQFKKQLVFRAILIIAILSVATIVNKEIIISFIPHQILI